MHLMFNLLSSGKAGKHECKACLSRKAPLITTGVKASAGDLGMLTSYWRTHWR